MEEAAKGALRRPDRAHGTAGKSGRKSARPGSACLHCLSLHGSVAPTYSGVLPTRAAVQCRRSSSAPPPAPPAPSCPLPPAAAPPSPPPPPHPPRASPAISLWGRRGGAHGGCALGSLLLGGRGGASVACVMGPPTCAILGRVSRLELARPCAPLARRSWHRAGKTRPARTSGTECHPALCAPNCLSGRSPRTANNTAERPATASRLVRPPLAAGRVRRGRLTRSPLFRSASPCRSCCIVLWSLLGCASVRVCALGARRKRRNR